MAYTDGLTVNFHKCSDDPRVLNKTMSEDSITKICKVYDSCSIVRPQLLLRYDSSVLPYNYMEIPAWGYWYKIVNIVTDSGKQMVVYGSVDALYTYRNVINNFPVTCIRNENINSNDVIDNSYPVDPVKRGYQSINIGDPDWAIPTSNPESEFKNIILYTI